MWRKPGLRRTICEFALSVPYIFNTCLTYLGFIFWIHQRAKFVPICIALIRVAAYKEAFSFQSWGKGRPLIVLMLYLSKLNEYGAMWARTSTMRPIFLGHPPTMTQRVPGLRYDILISLKDSPFRPFFYVVASGAK